MSYVVIRTSCDGISVEQVSKQVLKERLEDPDYYGPFEFVSDLRENNPQYWGRDPNKCSLLVIKGVVVVPQPEKKVVSYELP
jgi:hypothetical protein